MNLNRYQSEAIKTAIYKPEDGLHYTALGLASEAGEYAGKVKKSILNDNKLNSYDAALELGDVLWYLSMAAKELGYSLNTIALMNVEKLRKRKSKGTLIDTGGER